MFDPGDLFFIVLRSFDPLFFFYKELDRIGSILSSHVGPYLLKIIVEVPPSPGFSCAI